MRTMFNLDCRRELLSRPIIRELVLYWLPWPKARVKGWGLA
jgi:hypothetical protein